MSIVMNPIVAQEEDSISLKKVNFTTSIFDYIPSSENSGNINLGAEIHLKNRNSILFNIGAIRHFGPRESSPRSILFSHYDRITGVKIRLEGRRYLNRHKIIEPAILLFTPHMFQFKSEKLENTGYYIAFQTSFQSTKSISFLEVFEPENRITSYDEFISSHAKMGYKCIKKYGLIVDFGFGAGWRYVLRGSVENEAFLRVFSRAKGKGLYLNVIYQLGLGWSFN